MNLASCPALPSLAQPAFHLTSPHAETGICDLAGRRRQTHGTLFLSKDRASSKAAGMSLHDIVEMKTPEDIEAVRGMIRAYVDWLSATFSEEGDDLAYHYTPERLDAALAEVATSFMPSLCLALVARRDARPVGCISARPLAHGVTELKRLFVLPGERGTGLGRTLVETMIARMREWGYPTVRLDTGVFLTGAIALYRNLGFVEIAPYFDLPPAAQRTTVLMELSR